MQCFPPSPNEPRGIPTPPAPRERNLPLPRCAWLCSLLFQFCLASASAAQTVVGTVLDGETGDPIPSAAVMILNPDTTVRHVVLTNAEGRFSIRASAGEYLLRVDRMGYASVWSQRLPLQSSDRADFLIRLPPEPVELAEVGSYSDRGWDRAVLRRLDPHGFYERRSAGWGRFLTPQEIDRRKPTQIADLLSAMPGLRAYPGPRGSIIQGVSRAPRSTGVGRGSSASFGCLPTIYVNGARLPPLGADMNLEQFVMTRWIRGVEYYRDAISAPLRFQPAPINRATECGILVLWTYVGPE